MPATPATHFETEAAANATGSTRAEQSEQSETNGASLSGPKTNGTTFKLRYDTLVIAVGAYNQSESATTNVATARVYPARHQRSTYPE